MNEESLKVKIVADVADFTRDINKAKQATKEFGNESKSTSSKMDILEATIKAQKARLEELYEKYEKVVDAQGETSAAAKRLSADMDLLNTKITANERQLTAMATANKSLGNTGSIKNANGAMGELGDTLMNIKNLQMADVFINMMKAISEVKDKFKAANVDIGKAGERFKEAFEEIAGAFNFKNFDVGGDGIKGIFQSMKIQGGESLKSLTAGCKSLAAGFKSLGVAIKAAMSTAIAAIAAAIAVLVTFIALIKNAINTAQRLRDVFYEAQKIGMSASAYEEWAYILNQVGVGTDKLSDFLKTLADEQNAVRDGSEDVIKAFEQLGLSAEEVSGMSQEKLFTETVRGLQNLDNEVQRTSIAYRIFGEDAAELTNVINLNGAEMDRMVQNYRLLGGEASDSAIEKSLTLSSAIADLKTAWKGLSNTLGEGFMPMIISVVRWLTKAIAIVNMFVRAMFGFDIVSSGSKSSEGMNSYNDSMNEAIKTADKLKRTTQGFDELNIVSNPKSSGGGGDDGGDSFGGGGFEIPDLKANFEDLGLDDIAAKIEEWSNTIRAVVPAGMVAVGVIGGVLAALSGNWMLAIALFGMAGLGLVAMGGGEGGFQGYVDNFTTACNGLLVPALIAIGAIGGVISLLLGNIPLAIGLFALAGLGVAMTATDSFQDISNGFGQKVTMIVSIAMVAIGVIGGVIALLLGAIPVAIGLFAMAGLGIAGLTAGGFWDEIGQWFADLFAGIGQWCVDVWNDICEVFASVGQWFTDMFQAAWDGIVGVWETVVQWFQDVWDGICEVFSAVGQWFSDVFTEAWEWICDAWNGVVEWFQGIWDGICEAFNAVGTWFSDTFTAAWDGIVAIWEGAGEWFSDIWDGICDAFSAVGTWFKDTFDDAWDWVTDAWNGAGDWFSGVWDGIKNVFGTVSTWFETSFSDAWTAVKNVFSKGGEIFDGIKEGILDGLKVVINGIIEGINKVVAVPFNGLNSALRSIRDVSIAGFKPFDWIKTLTVPQIPKLATGGIAIGDTLAHIGEGGKREAVLPLDQNTEWMDILADRIAARSNTASRIVLQVDGRELGWATINNINAITKQTGGLQLLV